MVSNQIRDPSARIRCRRIEDRDVDAIVDLLTRGFQPRRTRQFWQNVMERLRNRSTPAELPRYGYLLENDGRFVGVILQIFSRVTAPDGAGTITRCNVSSWFVEPGFRQYAPLLVGQALKQKNVTYLNISSAPHTRPIAVAQGYTRYSNGVFISVPLLSRAPDVRPRIIAAPADPTAPHEAFERDLLMDHIGYGCVSLWCETPERAYPFVFRPRLVKRIVPCAQLVYCNDIGDFVRFARQIGWFLARRGWPLVVLDANGPVPHLIGRYFDDTMPRYCKG